MRSKLKMKQETKDKLINLLLQRFFADKTKIKVLRNISNKRTNSTELSRSLDISLPLVSYHINGNEKSPGLKDLGFIERVPNTKMTSFSIHITDLGKEVLKILDKMEELK